MPLVMVDKGKDGTRVLKFTASPSWPEFWQRRSPTQYLVLREGDPAIPFTTLVAARKEIGRT